MSLSSIHTARVGDRDVGLYEWDERDANEHMAPIVFIHGWGLSPVSYQDFLSALADTSGRHITAIALPGFGESDVVASPITLDALAEHVASTVAVLDIPDSGFILAGHSLGGAVAIRLAAQLRLSPPPEQLVLVSPAGIPHKGHGVLARHTTDIVTMALELRHELPHDPFRRLADGGKAALKHPSAFLRSGMSAALADVRGDLATLAAAGIPVTLVVADQDRVTPYSAAISVSDARLVEVRGTHGWILSHPHEAADEVSRVISG